MPRKKQSKNGKRKQISTYLTPELIERLHMLQASINASQKVDWKLWQVIETLIERGWQFTDLTTGKLKLPQERPAWVPTFAEQVRIHDFTSNEELFRAMDESPLPLWAAAPNNECLYANALLQSYTGRPAADFTRNDGMGWAEMIHPDDRDRVFRRCLARFKTRQPFRMVYRVRRADGVYGWIVDYAQPRYQEPRRFAGYVGNMYEIAEESDESAPPKSVIRLLKAFGTSD